ncbi:MAG: hypothetical protein GX117_12740 [Candidatus Hydrogenedentes bacterium]|nr:hypothetical protein [Candidatus Hydrogenedentota bacterium]
MRHRASLLASLEGMSHAAFLISKELSQNSRGGLTPRFLSKKLELSIEEIEYLVDVNPKLLYTDLTRIRLVREGFDVVKRILKGLESHGDVSAFRRHVRSMPDLELQHLESRLDLDADLSKKDLVEEVLQRLYRHPDSVVHYMARADFSARARDIFDILWQSKDGILTISQLYTQSRYSEYETENALTELFDGCTCFELFRFDNEQRLVRAVALLKEIRDYYRQKKDQQAQESLTVLKARTAVDTISSQELSFSETICRLAAAIAFRPVRLRNDGELFREDRRRLESICTNDEEPSLNTCLWVAEGLQWIVRVDNELRVGDLDSVINASRPDRHKLVFDWLMSGKDTASAKTIVENMLDELPCGSWFSIREYIAYARKASGRSFLPSLKMAGTHYEYSFSSADNQFDIKLSRILEESFLWLGVINHGYDGGSSCFQITELGHALLTGGFTAELCARYPSWANDILVQPNFEIIADVQHIDPLLTTPLDAFALRVSDHPLLVYRLDRDSFLAAMQRGHSAEQFITFLMNHNRGELPENVLITLRDWCGMAKQLRLRTYHVIESEDPLVIAEIEHHRQWREHVQPIDPHHVLRYQGLTRAEIKAALEKEGYIVDR